MRRTGKFYSRNEKETLRKLGLTPAPQSGAGWVVKEDGENESTMVQLKSTDAQSYRLSVFDMKQLEYHASVSNKIPIFLVQFLKQDKIYAIVSIEDIPYISSCLKTGQALPQTQVEKIDEQKGEQIVRTVKASKKARDQFFKERSETFGKRKRN